MEWWLIGIIVGVVLLVALISVVTFVVRRNRLRALSTALGSGYRKDRSYVGFSGAIALDEKSFHFSAIGEDEGTLIIGADEIIEARCEQNEWGGTWPQDAICNTDDSNDQGRTSKLFLNVRLPNG
jgi:type II secretory pathway pseudopilin PulG